jgi:hypothetical protein
MLRSRPRPAPRLGRLAALALALAACGRDPVTDPALHDIVPCSDTWAPFWQGLTRCEIACEAPPPGYTTKRADDAATTCKAKLLSCNASGKCNTSSSFCEDAGPRAEFEFDGVRGCCAYSGATGTPAQFAVCVGDP